MKRILVNFLPIKAGGGKQNAISFLYASSEYFQKLEDGYLILLDETSGLAKVCAELGLRYLSVKSTSWRRPFSEFLLARRLRDDYEICFTLFGPRLFCPSGWFLNITGCAYSNLFYPEIDFWGFEPVLQKQVRKVIDFYRKKLIFSSDLIVFETEVLRQRAIQMGIMASRTAVIRMAPSKTLEQVSQTAPSAFEDLGNGFKILYLCGAHPNKRVHLLPSIAANIRKRSGNVKFILTLPEGRYWKKIRQEAVNLGVLDMFINLGPIEQTMIWHIIQEVDALINIALLESFSNNFVEAWRMHKPLIATDADWARSACGTAALYINPQDFEDAGKEIYKLALNKQQQDQLASSGEVQLHSYPTIEQRHQAYHDLLNKCRTQN